MNTMVEVRQITASDTHTVRRAVLRTGTVSTDVTFVGDTDGVHFGAFDTDGSTGDPLVGIASWLPVDSPERPDAVAFQLRGMAVLPHRRAQGIGSALLVAGTNFLRARSVDLVVANARVSALPFYLQRGWHTIGDEYLDADTTGLPHQRIELDLTTLDAG